MKILAPARSAKEALPLINAGAGELYCGLHPGEWVKEYGKESWLNRRGPSANTGSLEELEDLVLTAHGRGVPVFLTLNLPFYPPEQYPRIVSMAGRIAGRCGIDALIIGDPGLMEAVRKAGIGSAIHVSSLASVLNSASAAFFRKIGADRIIFPRYAALEGLEDIIGRAGRDLEYEVFILNDGCVFEEGFCHASHAFGGAFCHLPWKVRLVSSGEGAVPGRGEDFYRHLADFREWTWCVRNCGGEPGPGGYPLGMCGLCALPGLKRMGIHSLKIVGREAPLSKKIASVRLVRKVLDLVEAGASPASVRETAVRLRGVPGLCRSGFMCYFR